jgi:hypothetical protein
MSGKDVVLYRGAKAVKAFDNTPTRDLASSALVKGSLVGGGVWLAAGLLPFINFPALLVIMLVAGVLLRTK